MSRENDVHSTTMNAIFQQEEIASHSVKNLWTMKENTKMEYFPFISSGNKQNTTVHMKDAEKFNEREKDCRPRRYDCEIDVKTRMNELMIHLILHDA